MQDTLEQFAYQYGKPTASAKLKAKNQDFIVNEIPNYKLTGAGEHLYVQIRKTGENTSFVANELAKVCGVASKNVSWAGLKDRHAVTTQWLCVTLPQAGMPNLAELTLRHPTIEVLQAKRHNKKLRPGDLEGNEFILTLTEVDQVDDVVQRLEKIALEGVPNYFGEQRFGKEYNNLHEARRWGRENVRTRNQKQRSLYLSAARSWIFNHIVSQRIEAGLFTTTLEGDVLEQDGQITAALAGDNALPTQGQALAIEQACVDGEPDLMKLIRGNRMQHGRRAIALQPKHMNWQTKGNEVIVSFTLDAGSFATSVMREVINILPVEREYAQ